MSEERQELAKHLNTRIGFSGFVSRLGVNRHVMLVSVSSPNDNNMLLNHVWITIKQKEYDKLKIDDYITFSGLVVRYRKNNTDLVGGGGYGKRVGDYGIETVKNIEVKQMVNMIGSTTPYVTKRRPLVEKVKEQPVIIEKTADVVAVHKKIPLRKILLESGMSLRSLAQKSSLSDNALQSKITGNGNYQSDDNFKELQKNRIAKALGLSVNDIDFTVSANDPFKQDHGRKKMFKKEALPKIESDKEVKNTNSAEITQSHNRNIQAEYEEFKRFEAFLKMKNGK